MANYYQIREMELKRTENYSEKQFNRYLKFYKIFLGLYSEWFFWSISTLPFIFWPLLMGNSVGMYAFMLFCHMIYWTFLGKRLYHKECDKEVEEIILAIEVLNDIKKEKYGK